MAMIEGDLVDVFDGDLQRWVQCRLKSIGSIAMNGVEKEIRVFHPIDHTIIDPGSGLRQIYGVPWPDGEGMTRPTQWPAGH